MAKMATRRRSVLQEPDEVLNLAQQFLESLKRHLKWLLLGTGVVILAAIAFVVTSQVRLHREEKAGAALEQVRSKLSSSQPTADAMQGLEQVIKEFPGTAAAREAELYRANLLYHMGKYAEAAKAYETLRGSDPEWAPLISESLSYCYEAQGDYQKAAEALLPAAEKASGPLQGEAWRRLAWLYEKAGNRQEAANWYQKLLEKPPDPSLVPYFKEKLAALKAAQRKK